MTAAHTPMPWTLTEQEKSVRGPYRPHVTSTGATLMLRTDIASVLSTGPWRAERSANARLIAAAPDLLEAAREGLICAGADIEDAWQACIEHGEDPDTDQFVKVFTERRDLIAAAISKATGQ